MLKKTLVFTFTILWAIGFSLTVNASTFDISIENVEPLDVSGFTIWLEVGNDFSADEDLFSTGSAIPDSWVADTNLGDIVVDDSGTSIFKIGYSDLNAILDIQDPVSMDSGSLFSFNYTGTIIDYYLIKLPDLTNTDYYENGTIVVGSIDENSLVLAPVPIPSAILLLGGGLLGILGIRRKNK
jgi:hypothetical protein